MSLSMSVLHSRYHVYKFIIQLIREKLEILVEYEHIEYMII